MKSSLMKGFIAITICAAMVLSNIQYAGATLAYDDTALTEMTDSMQMPEAVSTVPTAEKDNADNADHTERIENQNIENEAIENEAIENKAIENINTETKTAGKQPVLNTVSDNGLYNPNAIENLGRTEDGTAYILERFIEGKDVTVTMYIPIDLFTEAEEIEFEAVPITEEQEKAIEEIFAAETENEDFVVKDFAAYDINLYINKIAVSDFEGQVRVVFNDRNMLIKETEEEKVEVYFFNEEKEEVEILDTQQEEEGTAAAAVEHFSIYGYRILEDWERDLQTREGVLRALGLSRYFSVFTRQFSSTSHMEGIVAIENLLSATNIEISEGLFERDKHATDFSIELTKNLENSIDGGIFHFGFYEQNGTDIMTEPVKTTEIVVPQGSTSGSVRVDGFDGTKIYSVYELDAEGKKILQNGVGTIGEKTYSVDYSVNAIDLHTNLISGIGGISYIKNVIGFSNSELLISDKIIPEVVFGENNEIFLRAGAENMPCVRTKNSGDGGYLLRKNTKVHIAETSEYPEAFPIDFDKEFTALKEISSGLVSTETGNDIKVMNARVDQYGNLNFENKKYSTDGKLLIININCDGKKEVNWRKSPIIDGVNDDSWAKKYSNVIYNFYESNANRIAYSGKINVGASVHGTVFAPDASFVTGSNVVGNLIVRDTQIGGEVHQLPLTDDSVSRNIKVQCKNSSCGETTFHQSVDKSVQLVSWNERTYQIELYADAEKTTTTTIVNTKPIDAVLVLDVSGSMAYDIGQDSGNSYERLNALKTAVKGFISKTAETSPKSRIAIVTFSTTAQKKIDFISADQDGIRQLISQVDQLGADGGTRQDKGLELANRLADQSNSGNAVQVILFSDGVPDDHNYRTRQYQYNSFVENQANAVKNNQKVDHLYSIFLGEDNGKMPTDYDRYEINDHPRHHYGSSNVTYKNWFMNTIPSEGCGYTAESAEALLTIFEKIGSSIVNVYEVTGTIMDIIDNRFDLLNAEGIPITAAAVRECGTTGYTYDNAKIYIEEANVNGVITEYLKIVWENITIPSKTAGGWRKTLSLKAKEHYIGGNDVPTNGTGSGMLITTVDGNHELQAFPQPTVNVKVQFEIPDIEDVFFLGEKIGDLYTIEDMLARYVSKTEKGLTVLKHTVKQGSEERVYDYTDARDVAISTQLREGLLDGAPQKDTNYQNAVTVSVMPNQSGEYSAENMLYSGEVVTQENGKYDTHGNRLTVYGNQLYYAVCSPVTDSGDFMAYIVDGKLDIKKTIDRKYEREVVSEKIKDSQTFVFKIERFDLNNGQYVKDERFGNVYETISFASKDALSATKTLVGLREGYYKVTEETEWSWKYVQQQPETDGVDEQGYVHIGEREQKGDKVNFRGLDMKPHKYSDSGKYYHLPDRIKSMIDTDMKHMKACFAFTNLFTTDAGKRKWLGDVSIIRNIFE